MPPVTRRQQATNNPPVRQRSRSTGPPEHDHSDPCVTLDETVPDGSVKREIQGKPYWRVVGPTITGICLVGVFLYMQYILMPHNMHMGRQPGYAGYGTYVGNASAYGANAFQSFSCLRFDNNVVPVPVSPGIMTFYQDLKQHLYNIVRSQATAAPSHTHPPTPQHVTTVGLPSSMSTLNTPEKRVQKNLAMYCNAFFAHHYDELSFQDAYALATHIPWQHIATCQCGDLVREALDTWCPLEKVFRIKA